MIHGTPFHNLQSEIQRLYQAGEYLQALELLQQAAPDHPDRLPVLAYWQILLTTRLGNTEQALQILSIAQESGLWYADLLLRRTPALETLQEHPEFEPLLERNRELAAADPLRRFPLLTLRPRQPDYDPNKASPALLALHPNASSAQAALPVWEPLAEKGWLVGAVQSSQALWRGAYVWDDQEYTRQEVLRAYELFSERYNLDPQRTLLAGQDSGGEVAIWLAASGELPISGVIAIAPDGPLTRTPGAWEELLARPQLRAVPTGLPSERIYLLVQQPITQPRRAALQALDEDLNIAGYPAHLEILAEGIFGDPTRYRQALMDALHWILEADA